MTDVIFIGSLLFLCACCLASFIYSFTKKPWILCLMVPLIALSGSAVYFSYQSVLGYPIEMSWQQLPNKFTVIFFKIKNKKTIDLWLLNEKSTRLVTLPYNKQAEKTLEAERKTMATGKPVTITKSKEATSGQKGNGVKNGKRNKAGKMGKMGSGKAGSHGWNYRVESRGQMMIPGKDMPRKE